MSSYHYIQNSNNKQIPNSRKNIISGPGNRYWDHSNGLETPDNREEGPWPVMGNIGALLKQEGNNNYASCSNNLNIGGGPNCTGVFTPDYYTKSDTCGKNCTIQAPESFGIQSFGMNEDKLTNIHTLHSFENLRAAAEGKGPSDSYGCKEWIPSLKKTPGNSCELDFSRFENNTVGNYMKLNNNFTKYNYTQ